MRQQRLHFPSIFSPATLLGLACWIGVGGALLAPQANAQMQLMPDKWYESKFALDGDESTCQSRTIEFSNAVNINLALGNPATLNLKFIIQVDPTTEQKIDFVCSAIRKQKTNQQNETIYDYVLIGVSGTGNTQRTIELALRTKPIAVAGRIIEQPDGEKPLKYTLSNDPCDVAIDTDDPCYEHEGVDVTQVSNVAIIDEP